MLDSNGKCLRLHGLDSRLWSVQATRNVQHYTLEY